MTQKTEAWRGNWVAVERDGLKAVFDEQGHGMTHDLRADPEEQRPRPLADGATLVEAYVAWRRGRPPPEPATPSEESRRALEAIVCIR